MNILTHLSTFTYFSNTVRVVDGSGQPWFVAADVCRVLGLSNVTMAMRTLSADEKSLNRIEGMRNGLAVNCISEPGLYRLALRSDKPEARGFQDWVTREVLPAIRKDGGYILGEEKVKTGEMSEDELILKAMSVMQRKVDRLRAEKEEAEAKLVAAQPKIELARHVEQVRRPFGHVIRQFEGVSLTAAKNDLVREGIFFRARNGYRVYSQYRGVLFTEKFNDYGLTDVFVEPKGYELLAVMYRNGLLTMRKGCLPLSLAA